MAEPVTASEGDLRDYFRVLWHRKWLIGLVTLLGLAGALGGAALQTIEYTAAAQVLLQPTTTATNLASGAGGAVNPVDVATEVEIVNSAPVQAKVSHDLRGPVGPAKVSEVGTTDVIQVSATDHDPARAARIANAYANEYLNFRRQENASAYLAAASQLKSQIDALTTQIGALESQPGSGARVAGLTAQLTTDQAQLDQLQANAATTSGGAELVTPAAMPASPSSPKPKTDAVLGLIVGLALGVGAALLLEALDDRLRSADDLETATGKSILGVVPDVAQWKERSDAYIASLADPTGAPAEAYRQLRTAVQFANLDKNYRVLQVTSAASGEGKSTTAANLAVTLAAAGQRVVLIDADLRRPRVHQFFGLDHSVGLTSLLLGEADLSRALRPSEIPRLSVLTSGPVPPNPAELLASPRIGDLLLRLRQIADVVVVDGPPVLPVADAVALAARTDGVIVVAKAQSTTRKAVRSTCERLVQVNADIIGSVFNDVPIGRKGMQYGYGYYGGYGYVSTAPTTKPIPPIPAPVPPTPADSERPAVIRYGADS